MLASTLLPALAFALAALSDAPIRLESPAVVVEIEPHQGTWFLVDRQSGVRWPGVGTCSAGRAPGLDGGFTGATLKGSSVQLAARSGASVTFALVDDGRSLQIRYDGKDLGEVRLPGEFARLTDRERAALVIPCREGLLIPADSGVAFEQTFGASEYEGCHMNMLGFLKLGSVLAASWDGANVWPTVRSKKASGQAHAQELTTEFLLRPPARMVQLTPLGKGDWNTLAAGYRAIAERKGLASTLRQKIARNPDEEWLLGAANVKLWTCLDRRMNEESTKEEHVRVHWTFEEAARVAEHIRKDLAIDRCLFIIGGWTERGYDCRHPDNLPANPECGGDAALASAIKRIQDLGYIGCLHDNYQDMYKVAKSWSPTFIQKHKDGSLMAGGRWLGGRAYLVCAPKQLELATRPQNMPSIRRQFPVRSYFIDTTYAAGPQECFDPAHPLGRDDDIARKQKLSDAARQEFGLFGSECGREWALAHSDFFEGLVGVGGKGFHSLKPESIGAVLIPFWEMVYHDCQVCYGKYGYDAEHAAPYVTHHLLAARPLHYHSVPDHLYWAHGPYSAQPSGDRAAYARSDRGWAEGLHPMDVFLKNTQEILGPLNLATAHQRLTRLEFLTTDRKVRKATYGDGRHATTVIVNDQPADATVETRLGGSAVLPPWGFVVEAPRFAAFFARRWSGRDYPEGALFTIRAENGASLAEAQRVRVFHGFGDPRLEWRGATRMVKREEVIQAGGAQDKAAGEADPSRSPWRATGRVTDQDGRPMAGVEIWAHCGWGTLRRTGLARSGEDGRYVLEFGPGVRFMRNGGSSLQAATIAAHRPGYFEANLNRQGGCLGALAKPTEEELKQLGGGITRVFLPDTPLELDFVMRPAARVSGTLVDEHDRPLPGYSVGLGGPDEPPSSGAVGYATADSQGRFTLENIPTTYRYQFGVRKADPKPPWEDSWASAGLRFDAPDKDDLRAWFGDREIRVEKFVLRVAGPGVHGRTATPVAGNAGVLNLTAKVPAEVIEQSDKRLAAKSAVLTLRNTPGPDPAPSLITGSVPIPPAIESPTHLTRTRPNTAGEFTISFENPRGSVLKRGEHQVVFQVFVGVSQQPIREKIFRQLEIQDGRYEVPVKIRPEWVDDSRVSLTFLTIQPQHDAWIRSFFHEGKGTSYKGLWTGDGGLLPAIPFQEVPKP
jgi:hypothetical protein